MYLLGPRGSEYLHGLRVPSRTSASLCWYVHLYKMTRSSCGIIFMFWPRNFVSVLEERKKKWALLITSRHFSSSGSSSVRDTYRSWNLCSAELWPSHINRFIVIFIIYKIKLQSHWGTELPLKSLTYAWVASHFVSVIGNIILLALLVIPTQWFA